MPNAPEMQLAWNQPPHAAHAATTTRCMRQAASNCCGGGRRAASICAGGGRRGRRCVLRKGLRSIDGSHDSQLAPGVERREREGRGKSPSTLGGVGAPGTLCFRANAAWDVFQALQQAAPQVQPRVPSRCRYLPLCAVHETDTSLLGLYRVRKIVLVKKLYTAFTWTQHGMHACMHAPEAAASGRAALLSGRRRCCHPGATGGSSGGGRATR